MKELGYWNDLFLKFIKNEIEIRVSICYLINSYFN